jgi:hypothetical protein
MAKTKRNKGKPHQLTDMDVQFVSLVMAGANRQKKFLMVKTDDVEKLVPDSDATQEEKEKAREARSTKYKIEVLEKGSALTYPADYPTTEAMYGDPVNLKYPWGTSGNALDMGRLRNGLARFKQNYEQYTKAASRKAVYTRIVRKALAEDIDVSYDAEDPVDALLPQDLKDKLTAKDEVDKGGKPVPDLESANDDDKDGDTPEPPIDLSEWLDTADDDLNEQTFADQLDEALTAKSLDLEWSIQTHEVELGNASPGQSRESDTLKKELAELKKQREAQARALADSKEALRKSQLHAAKLKQSMVGGASGLVTGQVDRGAVGSSEPPVVSKKTATRWSSGGDLAAEDS